MADKRWNELDKLSEKSVSDGEHDESATSAGVTSNDLDDRDVVKAGTVDLPEGNVLSADDEDSAANAIVGDVMLNALDDVSRSEEISRQIMSGLIGTASLRMEDSVRDVGIAYTLVNQTVSKVLDNVDSDMPSAHSIVEGAVASAAKSYRDSVDSIVSSVILAAVINVHLDMDMARNVIGDVVERSLGNEDDSAAARELVTNSVMSALAQLNKEFHHAAFSRESLLDNESTERVQGIVTVGDIPPGTETPAEGPSTADISEESQLQLAKISHSAILKTIEAAFRNLSIVNECRRMLSAHKKERSVDRPRFETPPTGVGSKDYTLKAPSIPWLTIEEFNIATAEEKIKEYLKTWRYEKDWLYCVDYVGLKDTEFVEHHNYKVQWSIPTRRRAIPRATASVYFTFEVSKIKPKVYPVDVYFVFETGSAKYRPGETKFKQKWLKDIIENKMLLQKYIKLH